MADQSCVLRAQGPRGAGDPGGRRMSLWVLMKFRRVFPSSAAMATVRAVMIIRETNLRIRMRFLSFYKTTELICGISLWSDIYALDSDLSDLDEGDLCTVQVLQEYKCCPAVDKTP